MQLSNDGKRYSSMMEIASAAEPRNGMRASRKTAMGAWTGTGILLLLFLASVMYVVFGGAFEPNASPISKAEARITAIAPKPADVGGASLRKDASGSAAEPTDYFPAGYVNQGRDGDGNVMTYEHD
jgi:hypothetical protein